jgi:hypothetical protein
MTIPAFLSVDVEPDGFQLSRSNPPAWAGYRTTVALVEQLRAALAARTGAAPRFGWYFRTDPQIAEVYGRPDHALVEFSDHIAQLEAKGDYFGVHAHAIRWSEPLQLWVHDFADATWLAHSTRFALDAYASWAGAPAQRFRAGAGFLTNGIVDVIDQCGVRVDLTLEPITNWVSASDIPTGVDSSPMVGTYTDCHTAPRIAYRPARHDFRIKARRSGRRVVMIPLASSRLGPEEPYWKELARGLLGRPQQVQVLYPSVAWPSAQSYWDLVDRQLRSMRRPYVSLAIRTDAPDSAAAAAVRQVFDALSQHPLAERLRFTDPVEAAPHLI